MAYRGGSARTGDGREAADWVGQLTEPPSGQPAAVSARYSDVWDRIVIKSKGTGIFALTHDEAQRLMFDLEVALRDSMAEAEFAAWLGTMA